MAGLLKRTLYLASRHKDKKVTSAASTAFNYLLRSSVTAQGKLLNIAWLVATVHGAGAAHNNGMLCGSHLG